MRSIIGIHLPYFLARIDAPGDKQDRFCSDTKISFVP